MPTIVGVLPDGQGSVNYDDFDKAVNTDHRLSILMRTTQAAGEREAAVIAGCGVSLGDLWASGSEADSKARCTRIDARELSDFGTYGYWVAECLFSSKGSPESEDDTKPPEQRTPEWRWSFEQEEVVIPKDVITDVPLTNSVGEPLILTAPVPIPVLNIRRYNVDFDPQTILDYGGRVNSVAFWGADPKAALMAGITDEPVDVDGRTLRLNNYTIKFGMALPTEDWTVDLLDHGTKFFEIGAVSTLTDFATKQGNPTTGNLNGLGFALPAGAPLVYLNRNRFRQANFNDLKLGPNNWF